jgi:hypothetical protein
MALPKENSCLRYRKPALLCERLSFNVFLPTSNLEVRLVEPWAASLPRSGSDAWTAAQRS